MNVGDLIEQHAGHVALQFSGGRDSLAMLLSLADSLDDLTVYYCNSGDAFPETTDLVAYVREQVPHFVEVAGQVADTRARFGTPSDLMQAGSMWPAPTGNGMALLDRHWCCYHSIMAPLQQRMKDDGITLILRGQRDSDVPKSPVKNGETVDGFTIAYPIADWSTEDVERFIVDCGMRVPRFYTEGVTSAPDCMRCTAWLQHGAVPYLRKHHPDVAREVDAQLRAIRVTVEPFIRQLEDHTK